MKKSSHSRTDDSARRRRRSTTFAAANSVQRCLPIIGARRRCRTARRRRHHREGYGDGTYRGQNEITRQMAADGRLRQRCEGVIRRTPSRRRWLIARAAEFSEGAQQLWRALNLEDRIDNVKWTGELRHTYERTK